MSPLFFRGCDKKKSQYYCPLNGAFLGIPMESSIENRIGNNLIDMERTALLGRGSQILDSSSYCYVEMTLNFPRVKLFTRKSSDDQRKLYSLLFHKIKCSVGMPIDTEYHFEFCKSGHIHLHALLKYEFKGKHFPIGVISDITKAYYRLLPKCAKQNYNDKCMFYEHMRYRSPSICLQYRTLLETERIRIWTSYIRKEI